MAQMRSKKLQQALEAAGVEFIDKNGGGPGVRLTEAAAEEELVRLPRESSGSLARFTRILRTSSRVSCLTVKPQRLITWLSAMVGGAND
jgi:hypothetical protein